MKYYLLTLVAFLLVSVQCTAQNYDNMKYNKLSDFEKYIIIEKGTEPPFTGKYNKHYEKGTYLCKQCDSPLFRSDSKFDSGCGWPAFDDEIENAIKYLPDADGKRTEIVCANCGGHLGHVFHNEGFTKKNKRYCVNSASLNFIPNSKTISEEKTETAIFAAGCFWGVEHHLMTQKGVISTEVGYIGGHIENPDYETVCSGESGHAEAVKVVFDPQIVSFETLTKLFFEIHDPTTIDRQGPDVGSQYRSEIFYFNDKQKEVAKELIEILKQMNYDVVTELSPATKFYPAENYHQKYYKKTGHKPYCHIYKKKF